MARVLTQQEEQQALGAPSVYTPKRSGIDQVMNFLLPADAINRQVGNVAGAITGNKKKFLGSKDEKLTENVFNNIKDIASIGAYAIPGTSIPRLAASGAASAFGSTVGNDNLMENALATGGGLLTGGALGLAGKGVNKLADKFGKKGAEKVAQKATKEFDINEIYDQLGKPAKGAEGMFSGWQSRTLGVKGSKDIIDKPQALLDNQRILNSLGVENSERGISKGVSKLAERRNGLVEEFQRANPKAGTTNDELIGKVDGFLDDIVLASDKPVSKEQLRSSLNSYLKQSKFGTLADKQTGLKNLATPDLLQISSTLKKDIRGATPRVRESALYRAKQALVDQIDDTVEKLVPETTKYNRVMASLYNSQEATGRKALNAANQNTSGGLGKGGFFGLGDFLPTTEWANKGFELAGRAGNSLVNRGGAKVATEVATQPATGNALGNLLQNPRLAAVLTPLLQGAGQITPALAEQAPEPEILAKEFESSTTNANDIATQLYNSGMKVSEIKALQDAGIIPKPESTSLTADERKEARKQRSAIQALDSFEQQLNDIGSQDFGVTARVTGGARDLLGSIGLDPQVKVYNDLREGLLPLIAKGTGDSGALTDSDIRRAIRLLPAVGDSAEERRDKFRKVRAQISKGELI